MARIITAVRHCLALDTAVRLAETERTATRLEAEIRSIHAAATQGYFVIPAS